MFSEVSCCDFPWQSEGEKESVMPLRMESHLSTPLKEIYHISLIQRCHQLQDAPSIHEQLFQGKKKKDCIKSNHQLPATFRFQKHSQVKNMHLRVKKYGILIQRSSSINHFRRRANGLTGTEAIAQGERRAERDEASRNPGTGVQGKKKTHKKDAVKSFKLFHQNIKIYLPHLISHEPP